MNSKIREKEDTSLDTSQEQPYVSESIDVQSSHDNTKSAGRKEANSTGEICTSRSLTMERREECNNDEVGHLNSTLEDVRSIIDGDESDVAETAVEDSGTSLISTTETDPLIWMPPAPLDIEDDIESVANNDDDDEYGDGTEWGQSSCLNGFDIEHGSNFKEERQKAILEAMNGQFKILVSRFLASEDINSSEGGHESWRDIVASLSWEAASLIKPEANEGRAMDPGSYVKIKCIATGSRSQSEVVKGLVFKKNTAHKRMPTKCKNPRLLLLKGNLGQRDVGLSSFNSMIQETDYLKSINEMIVACHPNVVLVEKSVSRDMQEFLLAKGMTLVYDMKLTRLSRISRCIGSPIISCADILANPKVKQCDMFRIEKFVEEHNSSSEGGKRSSKTLMFLEGFPKPLGCTILLKGAHIDELKKVKRVMQYTVFAAYHLILETSFFADQRASFSDKHEVIEENGSADDKTMDSNCCGDASDMNTSHIEGYTADIARPYTSDIPSSDGSLESSTHESVCISADVSFNEPSQLPSFSPDVDSNENNLVHSDLFYDIPKRNITMHSDSSALPDHPWQLVSSFSATLKKFLSDSFVPDTSESFLSYFGFNEVELEIKNVDVLPVSTSLATLENDTEANSGVIQEKLDDEACNLEKFKSSSSFKESIEQCSADVSSELETQDKDNIESVMNPQSILVLLSSQCIAKGVFCEQSHLSRIKYYGNFDVSLGRYLQDVLLNKKHSCPSCGEPPEAHVYCYTHQNGNLTVMVRQLPQESTLSGEAEGKIWMWTRCLKCAHESEIPRSTHRVVMSTAARSLSFGKFLELSFSSHSVASRLSSKCGHSLHRDCLRFFGLGSRVAMFRYSPVEIYAVCKPPPVLEFYNPNGQEWIKREAKSVLQGVDTLFSEVANSLQKLKNGDSSAPPKKSLNFPGSIEDLSEVEQMLIKEKSEFEASLLKAINFSGQLGRASNEILSLSWLIQELFLELYIWDRRLHSLLQCKEDTDAPRDQIHEQCLQDNAKLHNDIVENRKGHHSISLESSIQVPANIEDSSSCTTSPLAENNISFRSEMEMESAENFENNRSHNSLEPGIADLPSSIGENFPSPRVDGHAYSFLDQDTSTGESFVPTSEYHKESVSNSDHVQANNNDPATVEQVRSTETMDEQELKIDNTDIGGENSTFKEQHQCSNISVHSSNCKLMDSEDWVWTPAAELRRVYRKDLHGGCLQKYEFIRSYTPTYLSSMHGMISQEKDSLHFPVGTGENVISVREDEISSIIACALALSGEQHCLIENIDEKDAMEGKGEADKASIDNSYSFTSDGSVASSYWSSTGSVDSEGMRSSRSVSSLSSDELSTSSSEGSFFGDRLIASENLHPEISVWVGKGAAKNKCSVVCVHAKQFHALRRMCCPSELAYISSLSHCKKWDAQGGKSKAFFAKTLDDRLVIKQIKKTEVDSFLKFAPDYFQHISYSINSGSQTCLAKILGIYQIRQSRAGKEVKVDLMVMENLLFGRNVVRTYDLKGALFSRYIADADDPEKVLLDENFIEDMRRSPMYIGGRNKHLFQRAIWNDTSFLTSINVMDYSLLVGVDKQRHELVFGIIDYLRQYTWDKQLETWVKSSLVVPKNSLPTVISPKEYKKRFRKFMSKYFLTVPDTWSSERCSEVHCKFCSKGAGSSSMESCQSS
ncbi:putative 1-phosphatidylinositol-3-phosphate 5-kinase FAB1B [Iris pallida]|uniref:1-phosphatidylinositol-3-phosphate 5-kinase n=1 Tax=Iris pallida TaxID=29817 RepID=A0AAX6ESW6_IRIPA|nr:putative 1-phosphatidylinositol-3-phosphate 5-kinase FAB1B [Iris pallida]